MSITPPYNMSHTNKDYHRMWVDNRLFEATMDIYNDPLWRGRFYVRRLSSQLELFEDGSGGLLYLIIRFYDKKTKKRFDISTDAAELEFKLYYLLNDFVNKCTIDEDPHKDITNWRNKK